MNDASTSTKVQVSTTEGGKATIQVSDPNAATAGRNDLQVAPLLPDSLKDNVSDLSDNQDESGDSNGDRAKAELNAKGVDESGITTSDTVDGSATVESANFVVIASNATSRASLRIVKRGTVGDDLTVSADQADELIKVLRAANGVAKKEKWLD